MLKDLIRRVVTFNADGTLSFRDEPVTDKPEGKDAEFERIFAMLHGVDRNIARALFDIAHCEGFKEGGAYAGERIHAMAAACTDDIVTERARILAAIQSCAPSDVPYSAARHEWARLGKKELFAQILKAIEIAHLAADGTSAAPETKPDGGQ